MIDNKELRLGNFVFLCGGSVNPSFYTIFEIPCREKFIQPINISIEILEKCGFAAAGYSTTLYLFLTDFSTNAFFEYSEDEKILSCQSSDGGDTSTVNPKISYVHQLQNLYFMLTGKELDVKL
jgi:hypothetical protein